jgi:hypothetical protein
MSAAHCDNYYYRSSIRPNKYTSRDIRGDVDVVDAVLSPLGNVVGKLGDARRSLRKAGTR